MFNTEYPAGWTPYTPLGDSIIIRPLTKEETFSSGGVLLPGTAEVTRAEGVVLAVGPGIGFEIPERIIREFTMRLEMEEFSGRGIRDILNSLGERAILCRLSSQWAT